MAQEVRPKVLLAYENEHGQEPYTEWFKSLGDAQVKARIEVRLRRLATGLLGDSAPVGEGVKELRMFFGPGYRIYFGEEADDIVILLLGGDKSTQQQDIKVAKAYWKEYQSHG